MIARIAGSAPVAALCLLWLMASVIGCADRTHSTSLAPIGDAPALSSLIPSADGPAPKVFRSVLDERARVLTARLHDELWVAYDASYCGLYRAWQGDVRLEGAVYNTVHGPQPTSRGTAYVSGPEGDVWRVRSGDEAAPVRALYRGHRFDGNRLVLRTHLLLEGRDEPIVVDEVPMARLESENRLAFDRWFDVKGGLREGERVELSVSRGRAERLETRAADGSVLQSVAGGDRDSPHWIGLGGDSPTNLHAVFALPDSRPIRVVYCTHSAGYVHDVLPLSRRVMAELDARHRWLSVTHVGHVDELTDELLARTDVLVFYTSGDLPLGDRKGVLLEWVRRGGGFVGVHSAADTLVNDPAYVTFLGGAFESHPWNERVSVIVTEPGHPIVRPLVSSVGRIPGYTPRFPFTDEIYVFRDLNSDRTDLMVLDPDTPGAIEGREYPLAWVRRHGNGRVFYFALGHRDTIWRDPRFLDTLLEGIRWTARRTD